MSRLTTRSPKRVQKAPGRALSRSGLRHASARETRPESSLQSMHPHSGVEASNAVEVRRVDQADPLVKSAAVVVTPQRVTVDLQARFNPIRNVDAEALTRYLDAFESGYLRDLARLMDAVEQRDMMVRTVVGKRKKGVSRYGWDIMTLPDADEQMAEEQSAALRYFYNNLRATDVLNQNLRGGLSLLLRQMMDAQGKRFAVHEIVWQPRVGGKADGSLSAEFRFTPLWWFENTQGRLRYLDSSAAIAGVDMDPNGWLVSVGEGLMISTVIGWYYKKLALSDWLSFSEKFGMPGVIGKTAAAPDSDQWKAMETAVASVVNDWAAVCSQGDELTLLETTKGATGSLPQQAVVDYIDRLIPSLWRGGNLSTLSQGSDSVGASLQGDETSLYEEDDIAWCEETLNENVTLFVLRYLFGDQVDPVAYLKLNRPPKDTVDADIKRIDCAVRNRIPLGTQATRERLQLPAPMDDEDLLAGPAPVAPAEEAPAVPLTAADEPADPEDAAAASSTQRVEASNSALSRSVIQDLRKAISDELAPLRRRVERALA